ncbi:MAG: hypothetical protein KF797_12095 [Flavobacteriales bacterium]|nr:hypothetical protein [Flavobacteriales bacterium]
MTPLPIATLALLLAGCDTSHPPQDAPPVIAHGAAPVEYPVVDDNIRHDTLLIQTTFDMGDGTFVMVASNKEETFEGLRLYHYRARPDSSAEILHVSAPAYDSWTMLPTFFGSRASAGEEHEFVDGWILANFGERESWGQKVMWFRDGFHDRGFMDVALPERTEDENGSQLKCANIAPHTRLANSGDTAIFTFACDSVFLYDDLAGRNDIIVPAHSIRYTYHPQAGLELWCNGQRRAVKQPG